MIIESIQQAYRVNQHDSGAPKLDVDDILHRSGPPMVVAEGRRLPWWRRVLRRLRGIR